MEKRLYYSLTRTQNSLHQYVKHILQKKRLKASPAQLAIMFLLNEKNNVSMSYISKVLELDNSAITRSIDRLEKFGFVKRVTNNTDRREFSIEITELGLSEIQKAQKVIKEINNFIESKIKKERLAAFKEILDELNSILREELQK
ncbi:MAG TPA: MarR family transcriptional regulator [Spirochaetota bacterium]|nr:MarR family transcriptional regulator [Spirochaetota bacterium]